MLYAIMDSARKYAFESSIDIFAGDTVTVEDGATGTLLTKLVLRREFRIVNKAIQVIKLYVE